MFPEAKLIAKLQGKTNKQHKDTKQGQLLALLRSIEGNGGVNHSDISITWNSVFDIDEDLEQLFHMTG